MVLGFLKFGANKNSSVKEILQIGIYCLKFASLSNFNLINSNKYEQ
jgi:hypothetical protein